MEIIDEIKFVSSIVLLLVGILLAFTGKTIFEHLMKVLGSIMGFVIGFWFGSYYLGIWAGLILGIIGTIAGLLIFYRIVKPAFAIYCGFFVATVMIIFDIGTVHIAIVAAVVTIILIWYLMSKMASVALALMGGIIIGFAFAQIDTLLQLKVPFYVIITCYVTSKTTHLCNSKMTHP